MAKILSAVTVALTGCTPPEPVCLYGAPPVMDSAYQKSNGQQQAPRFARYDIRNLEYILRGTMKQPISHFRLELKDGHWMLMNASGRDEENALWTEVPASIIDDLSQIIEEGKVLKYKHSYTPSMQILDGYTWNLTLSIGDEHYYSHGENAYPKGEGLNRIAELLKRYFEENNTN